jgi:Na+-driven multidrug efflux pump
MTIITFTDRLSNKKDNPVRLFSGETVSNLGYQFKLGAFGMMMGVWSVWAFDTFTLIASYLSISEVSAQTVMRSLGLATFMVPFGLSMASGMLVGRSIG